MLNGIFYQLGLPKETASAVAKVHQDSTAVVRQKLAEESLRSRFLYFFVGRKSFRVSLEKVAN